MKRIKTNYKKNDKLNIKNFYTKKLIFINLLINKNILYLLINKIIKKKYTLFILYFIILNKISFKTYYINVNNIRLNYI